MALFACLPRKQLQTCFLAVAGLLAVCAAQPAQAQVGSARYASIVVDAVERLRSDGGAKLGLFERMRQWPRSLIGMWLAHVGVAVFATRSVSWARCGCSLRMSRPSSTTPGTSSAVAV